jgi:hypothetical protein
MQQFFFFGAKLTILATFQDLQEVAVTVVAFKQSPKARCSHNALAQTNRCWEILPTVHCVVNIRQIRFV